MTQVATSSTGVSEIDRDALLGTPFEPLLSTASWEPNEPLDDRVVFVHALRVRPDDLEDRRILVMIEDHTLVETRFAALGLERGVFFFVPLAQPVLMIGGMSIDVIVSPSTRYSVERLVTKASREEAMAWGKQNQIDQTFPSSWYGIAELGPMKAKIDDMLAQAREQGLSPFFVQFPDDDCCAACGSKDPARGPYHAQLITKRDDDRLLARFGMPIVCGVCAEDNEQLTRLLSVIEKVDPLAQLRSEVARHRSGERRANPRRARRILRRAARQLHACECVRLGPSVGA